MKRLLLIATTFLVSWTNAQVGDSTAYLVQPSNVGAGAQKQYVSVPMHPALNITGAITLECWVYIPMGTSFSEIHLIESYTGSTGGYVLRISNGAIKAYIMNGGNQISAQGNTSLMQGQWNHVAMSYSDVNEYLYVFLNGVQDGQTLSTLTGISNTSGVINIGARGDDNNINSVVHIDDARIWGVEHSASQIAQNMYDCLSGTETGLRLFYDFEKETPGGQVQDISTNGIPGTKMVSFAGVEPYINGAFYCCNLTDGVTLNGGTITVDNTGAYYQWINCSDQSEINGETNQSFTPTVNGNYACLVLSSRCDLTSVCTTMNSVGLSENKEMKLDVYPNPASTTIQVSTDEKIDMIHIYNYAGRLIMSTTETTIDVNELSTGVYYMNILTEKGMINKRFVKE